MKSENQDIIGDKCTKDDDGNVTFNDKSSFLEKSLCKSS